MSISLKLRLVLLYTTISEHILIPQYLFIMVDSGFYYQWLIRDLMEQNLKFKVLAAKHVKTYQFYNLNKVVCIV